MPKLTQDAVKGRIIGECPLSKTRKLVIQQAIIDVDSRQAIGLDVRKYYNAGDEFKPTPKGVFLSKHELEYLLVVLGLNYENVKPAIRAFLEGSEEKIEMLRIKH